MPDGVDRGRRGGPRAHPALVVGEVLDPMVDGLAEFLADEVMHPGPLGPAVGLPFDPSGWRSRRPSPFFLT